MTEKEKYQALCKRIRSTSDKFEKLKKEIMSDPMCKNRQGELSAVNKILIDLDQTIKWIRRHDDKLSARKRGGKTIRRPDPIEEYYLEEESDNEIEQNWNTGCGFYNQDSDGNRSCSCGMDMIFCSKKCAYASNVVGSTKVYK